MPDCPNCGKRVLDGAPYCLSCGAAQQPPKRAQQQSSPEPPPPAAPPAAGAQPTPYAGQPAGAAAATPARKGQGPPGWAIALIVVAVVLVTGLPVAILAFSFVMVGNVVQEVAPVIEDQIRMVDERALRDGVTSIQTGVEAWAADHDGKYPASGRVDRIHLVSPSGLSYVDPWPQNPYAGGAMTQGTGEGQFQYVRGPAGSSYSLIGYGTGGNLLIALP